MLRSQFRRQGRSSADPFSGNLGHSDGAFGVLSRDQDQQRHAAEAGGDRAEDENGRVADVVPEEARGQARRQSRQPDRRAVPADAAGPQFAGRQIDRHGLADGSEDPLLESVEEEEAADQGDVSCRGEARIGRQEDRE